MQLSGNVKQTDYRTKSLRRLVSLTVKHGIEMKMKYSDIENAFEYVGSSYDPTRRPDKSS